MPRGRAERNGCPRQNPAYRPAPPSFCCGGSGSCPPPCSGGSGFCPTTASRPKTWFSSAPAPAFAGALAHPCANPVALERRRCPTGPRIGAVSGASGFWASGCPNRQEIGIAVPRIPIVAKGCPGLPGQTPTAHRGLRLGLGRVGPGPGKRRLRSGVGTGRGDVFPGGQGGRRGAGSRRGPGVRGVSCPETKASGNKACQRVLNPDCEVSFKLLIPQWKFPSFFLDSPPPRD